MNLFNKDNLSMFFSELKKTLDNEESIKKRDNINLSKDYNIFNQFFKLGENKISEILAFFLDPNETHGQGNVYLKSFLELICVDENFSNLSFSTVELKTEKIIDNNRRIDIYIDFDGGNHVIAIENKIWANDQPNQLFDYDKYLKENTNNYQLIYLTPYGQSASNISVVKNNKELNQTYTILDYENTIIKLCDKWISITISQRIKYLLEDFMQYLNQEINNINIMADYRNQITKYVFDNEQIEVFFKLNDATDTIKSELFEQFKVILNVIGFEVPNNFGRKGVDAIIKLDNGICILLGFETNRDNFLIDVITAKFNSDRITEIISLLDNLNIGLKENYQNENRIWISRTYKYSSWNKSKPWVDIYNGEMEVFLNNIILNLKQIN